MPRLIIVLALSAALLLVAAAPAAAASSSPVPSVGAARPVPVLAAFRTRFHLGSSRSYGYRYGYGFGGYRRRPSILHRVVRTAIWLYVLHLFFTHGGLSILLWAVIIGLVLSLGRRRRRRLRY